MKTTPSPVADAEEAVARILYARHGHKYYAPVIEWDALEDKFREPWLEDARLAIEAAAPYLQKQ